MDCSAYCRRLQDRSRASEIMRTSKVLTEALLPGAAGKIYGERPPMTVSPSLCAPLMLKNFTYQRDVFKLPVRAALCSMSRCS